MMGQCPKAGNRNLGPALRSALKGELDRGCPGWRFTGRRFQGTSESLRGDRSWSTFASRRRRRSQLSRLLCRIT